jgi:OmcA/MtrC family decaheme c-type cytochrome
VDPANINPDVVAAVGSDPLTYPEATNNFKNMIHGIHKASDRPYEFVRNRVNGFYYNWSEVTFPGDLRFCEKCHLEDTYRPENLPAGVLWETERTTTGDPAETRADIIAARSSVPNLTDLVDSPIAGACYYCHDDGTTKSHILLQGGQLSITREDALALP